MRKILTILFVLIGFVANSQYTPSAHTPINKPIAPAGAFPTDARSYYYDAGTFTHRPYASTAEVLAYLNTTTKRSGRFPIFVTVSGIVKLYMFKDGTSDGDLVEVLMVTPADLNAKQNALTLTTIGTSGAATLSGSNLNIPNYTAGGSAAWGGITGTLSSQTDLQTALNAKENSITLGTISQYWRGDKSWQTLDNSAVGLGNVPNVDATNASNIGSGTIPAGRYGATTIPISAINATGSPSGSTVLYGNGTWGTAPSSIYSADGTLASNRSVNLSTYTLSFKTTNTYLQLFNNGNLWLGSSASPTDNGYKLQLNGNQSIAGLLRINGPAGYGTNILEFTLNGNTTPITAINNFGIWSISNGGTNTVAASTGVIGTLGQNTSSLLLGSQVNAFGITQWTGTAGTSNHTSLAGPYIIVPNGSGGTFSGLTIGGTKTAGVLTDGYLISLGHWSNGGVLAMGNTTATQKYTVVDGNINVSVDQPNKTLEGYVWRPNITGSVALANNRAFISAPGANHGFGTLTPNNKAIAEFSDTLRGILPTRMTATQASALSLGTGEAGMYTYVSTTDATFPAAGFYYWSGTAWVAFSNTVSSGTYTPTFFTGTNTSSVSLIGADVFFYVRTGNLVEVTGTVNAVSSTTGAADFNLTIPIASDFTTAGDAKGLAINSFNGFGGNCSQNIAADRVLASYNANAGSNTINLKFTYLIR